MIDKFTRSISIRLEHHDITVAAHPDGQIWIVDEGLDGGNLALHSRAEVVLLIKALQETLGLDAEPVKAGGWRPIEAALKDGRTLLGYMRDLDLIEFIAWDGEFKYWTNPHDPGFRFKPTHWMPCPDAPEVSA